MRQLSRRMGTVASAQVGGVHSGAFAQVSLEEMLPGEMPALFTEPEHTFASLQEARQWLQTTDLDRPDEGA
jgi:hypothetical protein